MIRAAFLLGLLLTSTTQAQHAGHGAHPVLPSQNLQLHVRLDPAGGGNPVSIEVPLDLPSPTNAAELDRELSLPAPFPTIRLGAYLPSAILEQQVEAENGSGGTAAIELSVEGPTQAYQRWLIAGDDRRNQLTSLIGTWRYAAVADDAGRDLLFEQFKTERTENPKLWIRPDGASSFTEMEVKPGLRLDFDGRPGSVMIKEFYPHFAISGRKGEPENRSDLRINPAALVEIRRGERTEQRWVFAKFPDYQSESATRLPVEVTLNCPVDRRRDVPDYVVVSVGGSRHELFARVGGRHSVRPIDLDRPVPVDGTQYAFRVVRFVPSGRLVEAYRSHSGKGGVPALLVEIGGATTWLTMGKRGVLSTQAGSITFAFGPVVLAASGGHK